MWAEVQGDDWNTTPSLDTRSPRMTPTTCSSRAVKKKVPQFATLEDEQAFWDTTNIDALADEELLPSEVTVAQTPTVTISVRLSRADIKRLRDLAACRD